MAASKQNVLDGFRRPPRNELSTDRGFCGRRGVLGLVVAAMAPAVLAAPADIHHLTPRRNAMTDITNAPLGAKQLAIGPLAVSSAIGDMAGLSTALNRGLDAGMSIAEAKEILVQLYAYTGFPRALNALGEMMKVIATRRDRGLEDTPGREPGPVPSGAALLEAGTANQTKLSGAPVKGPLFDFAPAIDQFLKVHLFGDIFARDNLDWRSRELATVAALSALTGVESQLGSHIRISLNVGLTVDQLKQFATELAAHGAGEAAGRLRAGLEKQAPGTATS